MEWAYKEILFGPQPRPVQVASTPAPASGICSTSAIRRCMKSGPTRSVRPQTKSITRSGEEVSSSTTSRVVVMKDQGLIHEITTSVSYVDKILWVATYFGASRYDGRYWHNFLQKDSGLPSNFLNQIKGIDANRAWFSTDKGLAYYDGTNWAVYRPALDTHRPEMLVRDAQGNARNIPVRSAPAHNYILGVDFQDDD